MEEHIRQLIASGKTKDALNLLVQINGDALLLQAQYNNGEKQFNLGLIGFSDWQRIQARVNFAAAEMAGSKSKSNTDPAPQPKNSPTQTENMLVTFNRLFEDIQRDINGKNYTVSNCTRYVSELNRLTNTTAFSSLLDPTKVSDWMSKLQSEKTQVLKGILESIWAKKESLRTRIERRVDADNAETEFMEVLVAFFAEPNTSKWNLLHKFLTNRFSDKSLFSTGVLEAWSLWQNKLNSIQSDLDWGLDFKGSQNERDLKTFINKNLETKNFNS